MIFIRIPGHPVPKARARTVRAKGGKAVSYTPEKTRRWERDARLFATGKVDKPLSGAIDLQVVVNLAVPPSWPAWKRVAALNGDIRPTVRPDADNYAKIAKDAMNGVLWLDDAQVVDLRVEKRYSDNPGVDLLINEIGVSAQNVKRGDVNGIEHK